MKTFIVLITLIGLNSEASSLQDVKALALANGFRPTDRIVNAIVEASKTFKVDAKTLTAIAIIESGIGKYAKVRLNRNGTKDIGLFQINTVNLPKCKAFNLETPEGSAMCAAKLLSLIKVKSPSDVAKYHSKTPSKKEGYYLKMSKVINVAIR